MPDLKQSLRDFVATSNSGNYKTEGEVMSKFPELKGYDITVLRDFVATSNSGKYKNEDEVFAKFPEFKFSTPKKKVPTQVSKPSVGSSGTTKTPQKQSSDSSKPDGIYKYQGNLKANYKKENGQWYIDPTGGTKFQPLKQGDVSKRVKVLESQAKYDMDLTAYNMPEKANYKRISIEGVGEGEDEKYKDIAKAKVFTGFTGKEENKYRIVDNIWQRSVPNEKGEYSDWTTITNEGSIKALNSKFKQNAGLDVVKTKQEYAKLGFKDINSDLIGGDEADAVPMLNKRYGNLGFKFEEGLGDQMIVRSSIPGVKPLTINMDSWDSEKDANNAAILKAYLSQNALTKEREKEVSFTEQYQNIALDRTGNAYVDETKRLADLEAGKLNLPKTELQQSLEQQKKNERIQNLEKETGLNMREIQDEKARKAKIYGSSKVFKGDLTAAAIAEQNKVNKVYVNNEIKDINLRNKLSLRLSEQFDNDMADFNANYDTYSEEERAIKEAELKQKATELKQVYDQTKKDSSHVNYLVQSQAASTIASKLVAEKTGTVAGAIGRSLTDAIIDSGMGIYQAGYGIAFDESPITTEDRQKVKDNIAKMFTNTTSEFTASEDRSLVTSTIVALTQMAPAILANVATRGAASKLTGVAAKVAANAPGTAYFWGMGYSNAFDSMDGLDISDDDKRKLSFSIATATAALESYGLEKITSNKAASGFVAKRVARLLSGLPKGATMEMMNTAIYADMKKVVADKLIKVAGKGIIEGGVEVSQSAAEQEIKDLYEIYKDKDVFQEDWGTFGKNALREFLVGSFAGATVNSMSNLGTTVQQLSDPVNFGLSKEIATDEDLQDLFKNDLKSKIIQGEMSIPEAKAKLRAVGEFKALLGKVPSNMLETNQQEAMKLIEEKQKLQSEIEGKEPSLVEDKKQRIVDIDNEMKQLVEDDAKGEIRIIAKGLDQVPTEFRDRARNIGTLKKGLFGKTQDVYAYTVTRDEYTKLKGNAVQERSTEEVLPREQEQAGETGGQREGMGQSLEGQEATQEENPLSNVESTARALNSDLVKQIQDESGELFPLTTEQDLDYFTNLSERYHKAKQNGTNPELVNAFEKVLGFEQTNIDNTQKVEDLRAQEQAELIEAIPNAEQYMTDGKVDRTKITDENDLKVFDEIYNRYDKIITPLIKEVDAVEETPTVEQVTIDDVKTLDTTDATNLQRVLGFIESIENDLDNFGKGTLGMNLPVAVAKAVIKSIKVLLQAGVTLEQAIKQAAVDNNVTEQDIMDTMVAVQASQATQNRVRAKVTGQKAPKVSPAAKAAKAITKKPAPKMVTVDEMAALKDQIRLEARAARGAKANIKENIEKISTLIKSMVTAKGDIKQRHLKYIFNKLASTNLTSDESVDKLLDYIFKKMTDANYLNKLDEIEKINKAIKNNKNMVAEIKYLADMFTKIDLSKVSNIDKHLEIANKLKESLARYTKKTDPTGVEFRKNVDYQELSDYVSRNENNLKTKIEKSLSEIYDKLFGNGASNGMSEEDMIDKINKANEDKVAEMRSIVEAKLEELKNTIDEDTPDIVKRAVSLDPKLVPISDLIDIINGVTMYMDNGIVSGMKKIVAKYEGVEAANKSKVRFKKLIGLLGRKVTEMYNDYYNYADSILTKKTAKKGDVEQVKKESGAIDIERGYNKSRIQRNEEESKYKKKFGKIKNFNRSNNIVERRVIAHMQRERMDNEKQKTYFNDRKNLLKNSVDNLKNANNSLLVEQGKLLEAAAIKLGVLNKDGSVNESTTINDINSKTEKFNVDAVKYIQEMFSEIYDALYDHSLGFYNILLERDANYTPDVIKSAKPKKPGDEESAIMSDFARFTGMLIKKAGVLMTTNRPKSLAKDQYISLDFDQDMFEAYESALRDLYTSEHKQKFNAYRKSDAFRDIMGKDKDGVSKDAEFINSVYDYYITEKDGNIKPDTETDKAIKKFMNKLGLYNSFMALGSFKNIFAQSIPVWMDAIISTKTYLNPTRAYKIITDSFDPRAWDFVARCDSQVALRGEDAIRFTERVRNTIKKETVAGGVKNFAGKINYIPEMILKITNQYPDKVAAIGTWMGYYREYLDQNKLPFDYETPNADAINYAETRTKIQILPGDVAERGRIGKNTVTNTIFRQVFSPFSSVNMNAKNRIYGDVLRIFRGDRLNAMNDLIGATVGITSFHLINTYWKIYVGGLLASLLFGDDDDEEAAAKKEESYIKNALTQGVQDYISPMPMMDPLIPFIGNKIITAYDLGLPEEQKWNEFLENKVASLKKKENKRYTDEEIEKMRIKFFKDNQFQLRDQNMIEYADKYGSLAISYKQSKELFDIFQSATTGVYISEFNGKPVEKILPEAGKEKMKDVLYAKIAGLLSTDINRQAQQAYYKVGKEMSLTANQAETADEIKEWADFNGYKMDEYTYKAIKNESSLNKVKAAIRKMDSMSVKEKDEYIKSLKD
jgi:hypothetical protein